MGKVIVYNKDGVKILSPNPIFDIKLIADKDVPMGVLYKLIESSDLPSREFRNLWEIEINQENCDGVGLSKEEFENTYPDHKGLSVNE